MLLYFLEEGCFPFDAMNSLTYDYSTRYRATYIYIIGLVTTFQTTVMVHTNLLTPGHLCTLPLVSYRYEQLSLTIYI